MNIIKIQGTEIDIILIQFMIVIESNVIEKSERFL